MIYHVWTQGTVSIETQLSRTFCLRLHVQALIHPLIKLIVFEWLPFWLCRDHVTQLILLNNPETKSSGLFNNMKMYFVQISLRFRVSWCAMECNEICWKHNYLSQGLCHWRVSCTMFMSFLFVCFAFSDALNSIQSLHMGCHKRTSGLWYLSTGLERRRA